jgi:hypothetical protein
LKELALTVVFVAHAGAFGYFYLHHGRRLHKALFLVGFVALAASYGAEAAADLGAVSTAMGGLGYLRPVGFAFILLATLLFLVHLVRKLRSRSLAQPRQLEREV